MEHCRIVYDHSNKLKYVDRDEEPILVIFVVFQSALYDCFGERDMPSETERDAVSSGSLETTITKGCKCWHPRYDMGDGCFPCDVCLRKKFPTKELNLLAHCLIDIVLEL
jgi:hypothetical protein